MPELPEVESLRLGLERLVLGQMVKGITVKKPKLVSGRGTLRVASRKKQEEFIRELVGEKISKVERRAKNLIFKFSSGKLVLAHLKMSGQFIYREHGKNMVIGGHPIELAEKELPNKHTHVIFELQKGTLFYNDVRMFGYLLYYPSEEALHKEGHFSGIGKEPFDPEFTLEYFKDAFKKKGKLKVVLMNQEVVVGLGNIYADEVAFEAGVLPTRPVNSLSKVEIEKIYLAIQRILKRAVDLGGSSVATYRLIDDSRGNYAREHKVYGKGGKECSVCKKTLKKMVVAGRTTTYCSNCQK